MSDINAGLDDQVYDGFDTHQVRDAARMITDVHYRHTSLDDYYVYQGCITDVMSVVSP